MQVRGRLARSLVLALGLVAAATVPTLAADQAVTIQGFAYSPGAVTVAAGDTVTWTNRDGASHTATADDGTFDTGGIPGASTGTVRFTTPGEFRYHCAIHPDMTGRVIVQAAAAGATPPTTDTAAPESTNPARAVLPTIAFALLALAALSGALGWRLRSGRPR